MMEDRLWSHLPLEIIERVLSFLPVPDLCRCCVVCKRWNSLISTPKFGSLSLQNAKKGRCYIVARCVVEPDPGYLGWSILDLEARQWYSIKECDLPEAVGECANAPSISGFVAADGGLVCEYTEDVSFGVVSLIEVCNPLSKSEGRYVPLPPEHLFASPSDALINFVVDEVDNSFKVYFIYKRFNYEYEHEFPERALLHIYESTTGKWRSSTNPLLDSELGIGDYGSSIMFQGLLYVLFSSYDHQLFWLFRYNIVEDVWEDTNVDFELGSLCWPQLIVTNNRLYLVSWMVDELDKSHLHCRLYIEEILLLEKALSTVFQMTGEIVKLVFHLPDLGGRCSEIQAFGFEKSVMLMSRKTGISIVYDLVSGLWSQVPTHPMEPLPAGYQLWYGKPMNLRLPSIPW